MDFIYWIVVILIVMALVLNWVVFDLLYRRQSTSGETGNWGVVALEDNETGGHGSPTEPLGMQRSAISQQTIALNKPGPTTLKRKTPTCRGEVVAAARILTREKGEDEFTAKEIVDYLICNGTRYSANTIRNYIASRGCVNSAGNQNGSGDFMRVVRGRYRLTIG